VTVLGGLGGLLLSGCLATPLDRIPGVVESASQPDIPVPRDFHQKENGDNWSYVMYSSGPARFRSWVGEYVGFKQLRDLVPWYISQMTEDGWTHRGTEEGEKRILSFTNTADERALVILQRGYNRYQDRFQTIVRVEIGPQPTEAMDVDEVLRSSGVPLESAVDESSIDDERPEAIPASGSFADDSLEYESDPGEESAGPRTIGGELAPGIHGPQSGPGASRHAGAGSEF
jgi:hypothetical protein